MAVTTAVTNVIKDNHMGKDQHIVKTNNGWGIRGENNTKITKNYDTQYAAIQGGKIIAKNQKSELIVHGRDGKIREKNSYGNDNFPPKG